MSGNRIKIGTAVALLLSVLLGLGVTGRSSGDDGAAAPKPGSVQGRNNTVLFLIGSHDGLSNVHLATAFSLLQRYPEVDVHVATFPRRAAAVRRAGEFAGRPATFHAIEGTVDYARAVEKINPGFTMRSATHRPGFAGSAVFSNNMGMFVSPWDADDHFAIVQRLRGVIDEVDPAVIVLDSVFSPGVDTAIDSGRPRAVVSPNTIADFFSRAQPQGQILWKYPVIGSGFSFPVPLRNVPENVLLLLRFAKNTVFNARLRGLRAELRRRGLSAPISIAIDMYTPETPWISQEVEGAALPLEVLPPNVTRVGPIVVSVASVEEQDPAMAAWLARAPTVLVNLGSSVQYYEDQARIMAASLARLLESRPDVQVLWKMKKLPEATFGDEYRAPLDKYIASGRARIEQWLTVDPTAILQSGHAILSVHHGGGNVYHEAIKAGVPHVILAMWADLYNYATLVEEIGVGIWANRKTAPGWSVEELSAALVKAADGGPASVAMAAKAKFFADKVKAMGEGRDLAADILAKMAATGR